MKDTRVMSEADVLRHAAERMRRDGRPATAVLLDNAAYIVEGGSMEEYDWAERVAARDEARGNVQ